MTEKIPINTDAPVASDRDVRLLKRKTILQLLGGIVIVMITLGILGKFLKDPMTGLSQGFVELFGPLGVALGFFIPDTFPLPIWHDAFLAFGLIGGLNFWEIAIWATGGSLVGGTIAHFLGKTVAQTGWFNNYITHKGREVYALINRYGTWALAICAVSPIPYSLGAWSSGMIKMPFKWFFLVSLVRFPRILLYLSLIQLGVLKLF